MDIFVNGKPGMTVDAAAFVPPAFASVCGITADQDHVVSLIVSVLGQLSDIKLKSCISGIMVADKASVIPEGSVSHNAVKFENNTFA